MTFVVVIDLTGVKHFIMAKYIVDVQQHKNFCRIETVKTTIDTQSPAQEIIDIIYPK